MTLGVMLGGAALAFAASPGRAGNGNLEVFRGYLDTRSVYGPVLFTLRVDTRTDAGAARRLEAALVEGGQDAMFAADGQVSFLNHAAIPYRIMRVRTDAS